jgi:hypothetical protein
MSPAESTWNTEHFRSKLFAESQPSTQLIYLFIYLFILFIYFRIYLFISSTKPNAVHEIQKCVGKNHQYQKKPEYCRDSKPETPEQETMAPTATP